MELMHLGAWAAQFDEEGNLWFSDFNFGGLYKYNINSKVLERKCYFEEGTLVREALHCVLKIKNDDIILFPLDDSDIRIYNKKTNVERKIIVTKSKEEKIVIELKDRVWLFFDDRCLCFDYENNSLSEDRYLTDIIKKIKKDTKESIRIKAGDTITIWVNATKELYNIDPFNKNCSIISLADIKEEIIDVYYLKSKYWIFLKQSHNVFTREKDTDKIEKYIAIGAEYVNEANIIPYSGIYFWADNILLPNYYGKYFMKLSEERKTIERAFRDKDEQNIDDYLNYGACYYRLLFSNDFLYCIPQRGKYLLKCDSKLNIVEKISMEFCPSKEDIYRILDAQLLNNGTINERKEVTNIYNFLNYLVKDVKYNE